MTFGTIGPWPRRLCLCLAAAGLLTACASPTPVRYYRIDALELAPAVPPDDADVMSIGRITFPEYLQRPHMVRRGQGAEMVVDELSRWAEPLDEAVPRILAANVDGLTENVVVVPAQRGGLPPDYRLFASVLRLDTDLQGQTELVVQWSIAGREGASLVRPRTTRYQASARPAGDPGAMAEAVSDVLARFSQDVADALRAQRLPDHGSVR